MIEIKTNPPEKILGRLKRGEELKKEVLELIDEFKFWVSSEHKCYHYHNLLKKIEELKNKIIEK